MRTLLTQTNFFLDNYYLENITRILITISGYFLALYLVGSKMIPKGLFLKYNNFVSGVKQHEKIVDGHGYFNTCFVVLSLRDNTTLRRLDIRLHVMTLDDSRVVGRISHNYK